MKLSDDNPIVNKSFSFALVIMKISDSLIEKRYYAMAEQLMKSGTSIGANVREGIRAQSKADFISKFSIALKEASETEYWLDLLYHSGHIIKEEYDIVKLQCVELIRMLMSITKTARNNLKT